MTARALFGYTALSLTILWVAACFVGAAPIFKVVLFLGALVSGAVATDADGEQDR